MAELRQSPGARRKVAVGRLNLIVIKYNLYRKGLQRPGKDLSQVRKLIAMAAQLVSHLDSKDFKGSIYSGDKLDLAKKVKETLEQAKLGDKVYFSLKSTFVMFSPSAIRNRAEPVEAQLAGCPGGQGYAADQLLCFCVCVL